MLSPKTQYNLSNAKKYFAEHLSVGEYYTEGERLAGRWFGIGAGMLGLEGKVDSEQFIRLCDNLHPQTGELLTQRQKTTRMEADAAGKMQEVANRRVFYDFTVSPPKSVSILALVADDRRIFKAHDRAIQCAMKELELFAATRVRVGGQHANRMTSNVVGAIFQHDTSRALDPHLHSHCILFNASFDQEENRGKALENSMIFKAQKFVEGVYYHELARDLRRFGYEIENSPRGDFQVKGVGQELCQRFSKRHQEIDQKTKELLARQPEKAESNISQIRENIAQKERVRKITGVGMAELRKLWGGQMKPRELKKLVALRSETRNELPPPSFGIAEDAIGWAEEHLFERRSVIREKDLWQVALERARGEDVSVEELKAVTAAADYIRYKNDPDKITTDEVLEREIALIKAAKFGANRYGPLCPVKSALDQSLDDGQRDAVEHILSSKDFVTLFRGGAGTGKSFTLREVATQLQKAKHHVHVVAPQRQQVMDLARDGFANPKTLTEFLTASQVGKGEVVIVDEAGQIGAAQMKALFDQVEAAGARIVLSGDTRQHGAVEASDALWAIEKYAGLKAAELRDIRRQDPAKARTLAERQFIEAYKKAVEEAANGKIPESFKRLEEHGAVLETPVGEQQQWLTAHYLEHVRKNESALVVSQTWDEIHKLNDTIREALKAAGVITKRERTVTALERIDLTDAQKRDARYYSPSSVVIFNRNAAGFKKGETAQLHAIGPNGLLIKNDRKIGVLSNLHVEQITVCEAKEMPIAAGDRLQLKANSKTALGHRLANGELVTVKSVGADGTISLKDGRAIPPDYRQFGRGYAVTSYASQGKTVDYVLFSDSAIKAATNSQQWYVSISRGRKGIRIFTTDKEQLRENVSQIGDRPLALDLIDSVSPEELTQQPLPGYRQFAGVNNIKQYAAMIRLRVAAWAAIRCPPTHQTVQNHAQRQSIR